MSNDCDTSIGAKCNNTATTRFINELSFATLANYVHHARQYTPVSLHQASNRIRGITTATEKTEHIKLIKMLMQVGDPRIRQESVVVAALQSLLENNV